MIKVETLGMLDVAKVNPILTSESEVKNYSFITVDDELYLISNTITGDKSYAKDATIPAGDYLNGFLVEAWKGQKLIIDGCHVEGGISTLEVGNKLVAQENGLLKKEEDVSSGVYFVVTDTKVTLTEAAIKAKVAVATSAGA